MESILQNQDTPNQLYKCLFEHTHRDISPIWTNFSINTSKKRKEDKMKFFSQVKWENFYKLTYASNKMCFLLESKLENFYKSDYRRSTYYWVLSLQPVLQTDLQLQKKEKHWSHTESCVCKTAQASVSKKCGPQISHWHWPSYT